MGDQPELNLRGDASDAIREVAKLESRFQKAQQTIEKLKDSTKRAGKERRNAFGSAAVSQLRSFALQVGGVTAMYAGLRSMIQKVNEERERGQKAMRAAEAPLARLLSIETPERPFKLLRREVNRTRAETGMGPRKAGDFQFALESGSIGKERKWLAGLAPAIDPTAMAAATGAMVGGFGPAAAGKPRQVVNMLLAGAAESPLTPGGLATVIGPLGESFQRIGGEPGEVIAAIAGAARAAGPTGGEKAAMAQARLADFLASKKRFEGLGFFGGVEALKRETAGMSPSEILAHIPEKRAARGFGAFVQNEALIRSTREKIKRAKAAAPGEGHVARIQRKLLEEPELGIPRQARAAEAQFDIALQNLPSVRAAERIKAAKAFVRRRYIEEGRWVARAWMEFEQLGQDIISGKAREVFDWEQRAWELGAPSGPGGLEYSAYDEITRELKKLPEAVHDGSRAGTQGPTLEKKTRGSGDPEDW